jgi:hypothetical protein
MTSEELVGFFLSTDPMHAGLKKTVDNGRALAVAYRELQEKYSLISEELETTKKKNNEQIVATQKDREFYEKEIKRVSSQSGELAPLMVKLLEIENLLLKK